MLADRFVPGFVGEDAGAVGGRGRAFGSAGTEPLLLVHVQAKVAADVVAVGQFGGEFFGVPAVDGLIPPAGPLDDGQAVERLEVHERVEAFAGVHVIGILFPQGGHSAQMERNRLVDR